MKKITALVAQEKNKKRVNVFLDGEFYCGMNLFTVMSNRLKVGDEVDEVKLSEISAEDNYSSALDLALNYISRAMHTKMQMIIYLKKKGFDGKTIARVIDKLEEYDYVNDEIYAQKYAAEKARSSGKRKIAYELKVKGINEKITEEVLGEDFDEEEGCYNVAKRYLKGKTVDFELRRKCYRYLIGKGFGYETAKSALDKICGEYEDNQI